MALTYKTVLSNAITSFKNIQTNLKNIGAWYYPNGNTSGTLTQITNLEDSSKADTILSSTELENAITHLAVIKHGNEFVTGNVTYLGAINNTLTTQGTSVTIKPGYTTGGTVKVNLTSGVVGSTGGSVSGSNISLSETNSSGISVTGSGKGTVTTAGYLAAGTIASSASSQTKYLTALTVVADKTLGNMYLNAKGSGTNPGTLTTLTNNGKIGTLNGTGSIGNLSGTQTVGTLSGTITISATDTTNSKGILVALGKTIINNGSLVQNTCTISGGSLSTNMETTTTTTYYVDRAAITDAHSGGWVDANSASNVMNNSRIYIKPSTTGSVTALNSSQTGTVVLDPGKQVTISKGYYGSDRIIQATKADEAGESVSASGFSLSVTDSTSALTIGALRDDNTYPIVGSITGTFKASTAGWFSSGTATDSSSTLGVIAAGACTHTRDSAASTSITKNPSASILASGIKTSTIDTGYSVVASAASGVVTASVGAIYNTVSAGFMPSKSKTKIFDASSSTTTEKTASQTVYIQKGVLSSSGTATAGSASMGASGFTASSSATDYYVNLTTNSGSVSTSASVSTEGYVKSSDNKTGTTTVSVSGNGNKLYIPKGSLTGNGGSVSSSGLGLSTTNSSGISVTGSGSVKVGTAGYIPANTSSSSGNSTQYVNSLTLGSGKTLDSITNNGTISTMSGTGIINSNTGTVEFKANTGTVNYIGWKLCNNTEDECLEIYF